MNLDSRHLANALMQLENGLREAHAHPASNLLLDGAIHRFNYSHQLSFKFICRALETVFGDPVDQMAYNDILRVAAEHGLIDNVERWFTYRSARNKTSHTYDAAVAAEVFAAAMPFLEDSCVLLRNLDVLPRRSAP